MSHSLYFSRLFTVPKPEKGIFRPIIDLSELNKFLIPKFRMETFPRSSRTFGTARRRTFGS